MPGLTSSMLMAMHSLLAQEAALNVATNNIANANTPGYAREIPVLTEATPSQENSFVFGNGVDLQQVTSVRDRLLELRINAETQQQGNAQAQLDSLQQVQGLFADSSHGIGAAMTAFFNSLNRLSTDPTSLPARQAVLTAGSNLADAFHTASAQVYAIQNNVNLGVTQAVQRINQLTAQIAGLNAQVGILQNQGKDAGVLEDQRNELVGQLSQLTDVSVIQTEQGETITTGNGTALVVGGKSFALRVTNDPSGLQRIAAQGQDITSTLQGGRLGGLLYVRDQFIPGLSSSLDSLAGGLATAFNAVHHAGFDLAGNAGQDFFSASAGPGAANSFAVAITNPSAIAASSDGSPASNGNATALAAVQSQALASGKNPMDSYATVVFNVGNAAAQANAELSAGAISLQQLTDQRSSVSGVSINEETTNLIRYQHAFQAAARVVSTVDQLTQTVLAIGTPAGG